MGSQERVAAKPRYYQAIIKVCPTDPHKKQADDIADGIGYACVLLLDEHGWSADRIAEVLERVRDEVYEEAQSDFRQP